MNFVPNTVALVKQEAEKPKNKKTKTSTKISPCGSYHPLCKTPEMESC
jgi:hypothetical protein